MKRVMVGVALVATLALAGCSPSGGDNQPYQDNDASGLTEKHITLSDGRQITCIIFEGYQKGGISCDWEPK